jgi:tripartite-type tricarboxylate transporter receptor subunit TctC
MRMFRSVVLAPCLLITLIGIATPVAGESWPQRPVRVIVPFGAGSAPNVAARLYAERLAVLWKRPVIIENRTGADGLIGVTVFVAMRDDHALLFSPAAPISVFPYTHEKLTYDPGQDFVPIAWAIDTFGSVAAAAALNVTSLAELVRLARAQPGKLNWTSGGGAFTTLLAGFVKATGVNIVQVSYREQNLAVQDLAEGRIQILATTLTALWPFVQTGKIRVLAVTNKTRAPIAPAVPTANEAGYPELEFEGLLGFFGGRGMLPALRDRIAADIRATATDKILVERLAAAGQVVRGGTAAEFAEAIEEQRSRIESIVRLTKENR